MMDQQMILVKSVMNCKKNLKKLGHIIRLMVVWQMQEIMEWTGHVGNILSLLIQMIGLAKNCYCLHMHI